MPNMEECEKLPSLPQLKSLGEMLTPMSDFIWFWLCFQCFMGKENKNLLDAVSTLMMKYSDLILLSIIIFS